MNNRLLLLALCSWAFHAVHAMETKTECTWETKIKNEGFVAIVLPGQNGCGGDSFIANHLINTNLISRYQTLEKISNIDLGQENCIAHFEKQLYNDPITEKFKKNFNLKKILYGVSQGTATLTNWLAQQPQKEQEKIGALILESVLGTGNSAISHTVESMAPCSSSIPESSLAYTAKVVAFPAYKPNGLQALNSAKKLSNNLPVLIMHHENDPQLSIDDARKLYCTLREQGNKNVYFIEVNNQTKAHLDILNTITNREDKIRKIAGIQAFFKKYNMPYSTGSSFVNNEDSEAALTEMQPSPTAVRKKIKTTLCQTMLESTSKSFSSLGNLFSSSNE